MLIRSDYFKRTFPEERTLWKRNYFYKLTWIIACLCPVWYMECLIILVFFLINLRIYKLEKEQVPQIFNYSALFRVVLNKQLVYNIFSSTVVISLKINSFLVALAFLQLNLAYGPEGAWADGPVKQVSDIYQLHIFRTNYIWGLCLQLSFLT